MGKSDLKNRLKQCCLEKLEQQIGDMKKHLDDVQQASNQETKSTAGDKHDTARAQAQIEVERIGNQLLTLENMMSELRRLTLEEQDRIQLGTFVETGAGHFYLSVALGKVVSKDLNFFAISLASPLGKLLLGKGKNDSFTLPNGQVYKVLTLV